MGTPFQANFFAPVIEELKDEIEFFITARDHDNIKQILDAKRIPYTTVGRHGGKELEGKLEAYAKNIEGFIPIIGPYIVTAINNSNDENCARFACGLVSDLSNYLEKNMQFYA